MTIEAFILCFNEEKMIEHTLNYYSSFCDKITIIDNQSTDNSVQIAKEKFSEKVEVVELDTDAEYREDVLVYVRNNYWKNSDADYVIMCDMDEFLYAENLKEQIELMHKNNIAIPVVTGYNMLDESFPKRDLPLIDQVKTGFRDRSFDKSIIFSPKKIKEINYGPGSHYCNPVLKVKGVIDSLVEFKLLHYKYLGKEYIYKKHQTYSSRMSDINKQKNYGHEYDLGNAHVDKIFDTFSNYLYKIIK